MRNLFFVLACAAIAGTASAITVSTGDLGNNVIFGSNGGNFDVVLNTANVDNSQAASMTVKYGLWNGSSEHVDVFMNGPVGSFEAANGYISPGPEYVTYDITGMLNDGDNTITFQGDLIQDYVVGQVDITYEAVPEPATLAVFGIAGAALLLRRRRR